jgi:hypothetical protein
MFLQLCGGSEFWISLSAPIMRVHNTAGLFETVVQNGGGVTTNAQAVAAGAVSNMTEAFAQPAWNYGRIDTMCKHQKTGLADITAEVGYRSVNKEHYRMDSHLGILLPTGNKVNAVEVFQPIVGHNHQLGVTFGGSFCMQVSTNDECQRSVWMEFTIQNLYLFSNTQQRLVDLKLKPWSRYMEMYSSITQAQLAATDADPYLYTPGVNILAQDVCVSNGLQRTYNSAFLFNKCNFQAELGYNFFVRSAECVKLACPWVPGPALKAIGGLGATNNVQQINNNFGGVNNTPVADYNNNLIQASDLNLESAAHPATITHTPYVALGYRWDDCENPVFLGAGGSYEFARDNNLGMDRWMIWVKSGVSF